MLTYEERAARDHTILPEVVTRRCQNTNITEGGEISGSHG